MKSSISVIRKSIIKQIRAINPSWIGKELPRVDVENLAENNWNDKDNIYREVNFTLDVISENYATSLSMMEQLISLSFVNSETVVENITEVEELTDTNLIIYRFLINYKVNIYERN